MLRFILLFAALAVFTAACAGGGTVAATVDGVDITTTDVSALIFDDPDAVDSDTFSVLLFNLIANEVFIGRAAEDFGITVSEEEFQTERQAFIDERLGEGQTLEEMLEANNATAELLDVIVAQRILVDDIVEKLVEEAGAVSEAELEAAFEERRLDLTEVCARHILLETEEEAQAALERAVAGEDFAALAVELSTGPSGPDGGDLGCASPAGYVPEFADATLAADVGVPVGPVQTDFGFHVILVSERTEPTFEESRPALAAELAQGRETELLDQWRIEVLTAADVVVNEKYGRWVTDPLPQLIPPDA